MKNKINGLEQALNKSFADQRSEVNALKEILIQKEKQIDDFNVNNKLTREEKEAIKFFEDNYIQSESLSQIIFNNNTKTLNSTDELAKQILTDITKITESGVTEVK